MTAMWLRMTAMWAAMMVPMMLPSLVLRLHARPLPAAVVAAVAYFLVWTLFGAAIYPPTMYVPVGRYAAAAFVVAGFVQLTPWKVRLLDRCRTDCSDVAWRDGLRMGLDCSLCCTGYVLVLLVTGMMNWAAMILVTVAITAERLLPRPALLARIFGVVLIACAAFVTGSPPRM